MNCSLPILAAAALCAAAAAHAALHGEVVEFGETTVDREHPMTEPDRSVSLVPGAIVEGIHFVGHSSDLEAQLCLNFGVIVHLMPDPGGTLPRELTVVNTHPRLTRPDGVSNTQDTYTNPVNGNTTYAGWKFEYPWEMQPGDWTISFLADGEVVASKTFKVTVPQRPGSLCPGKPTS